MFMLYKLQDMYARLALLPIADIDNIATSQEAKVHRPKYLGDIFQGINAIATNSFKNGDLIAYMNSRARLFLYELSSFEGNQMPPIPFEQIYGITPSDLMEYARGSPLSESTIGLSLEKRAWNSVDDQVCPKFIEILQSTTLAYLARLACGWKETHDRKIKCALDLTNDSTCIFVNSHSGCNMSHSYLILQEIADKNAFNAVRLFGTASGDCMCGTRENLSKFIKLLRQESPMPAPLKLLKLAKVDKKCHLYTFLPLEIIELIIEKYFAHIFNRCLNPLWASTDCSQ